MKVKILVEFEVSPLEGEEATENELKGAASMAAWDCLSLTANGIDVSSRVIVHVDGFGECAVEIGEDHA